MKKYSVWFNEVEEGFDEVGGWVNILNTDEMRGKFNIYAHTHNHVIDDWRYFCTSMEQINYKAVSLQEIRKVFDERRKEQDLII